MSIQDQPKNMTDSKILRDIIEAFVIVDRERPKLLPTIRYFVVASQMASGVLERAEPNAERIQELLALLQEHDQELAAFFVRLTAHDGHVQGVLAELLLEKMLERPDGWEHPAEFLPRPPLKQLVEVGRQMLADETQKPPGDLLAVQAKLERALRLSEQAARRRAESGQGSMAR